MNLKLVVYLLFSITLTANGQSGHRSSPRPSGTNNATTRKDDACSLLTNAEVEAVQGERVQGTKPGSQLERGIMWSQCIYQMITPSKSVSLSLFTPGPQDTSRQTTRNYWRQQFRSQREADEKHDKDSKNKPTAGREEEGRGPTPVKGLGEEAYWISNRISSVLYVLQGDRFVRISIGGVRDESARLEKSKTLAREALKRL